MENLVAKKALSEDWLALILGLLFFVLSLGVFGGADILGWGINTKTWIDPSKALSVVSKTYAPAKGEVIKVQGHQVTLKTAADKEETITVSGDISHLKVGDMYEKSGVSGSGALFFTFLAMLVFTTIGAAALRSNIPKFVIGFTVIFWLSYLCWFAGHYAHIAATKNDFGKYGIAWSISMTGEFGFIIALVVGLLVGNFLPGVAEYLRDAARPELYIKTAIVIMGAGLGLKAAESLSLATNIMFRGFCAIVEAYLIYWALTYFIARRYFKFSREWSAPLASGISICGVSAAIATGGAINARPIVPIMVSSLIVIFVAVEMVVLPFVAQVFMWHDPLVAGAWMGLAVKSDGGAVASGAITDALIRAQALNAGGIKFAEGWITMTTTTVKMFIDIFIGIWAFILAVIWCTKIEARPGQKVRAIEIWNRFPKFVMGYAGTFFLLLILCWPASRASSVAKNQIDALTKETSAISAQLATGADTAQKADLEKQLAAANSRIAEIKAKAAGPEKTINTAKASAAEGNVFRVLFFVLTFFTIGLVSNFKKLKQEGIGKLAAVYVVCLFGFIIWIGLFISWLFFHGVLPPVITS
jgi:uncharacterized membrane protein YadS